MSYSLFLRPEAGSTHVPSYDMVSPLKGQVYTKCVFMELLGPSLPGTEGCLEKSGYS